MSSADENELIQGLVDMAEAYWDERTALRARVAELEAFEAAAKARMVEYAKTNAELADWVTELQRAADSFQRDANHLREQRDQARTEREQLAAVVERVRQLVTQLRERAWSSGFHRTKTALEFAADELAALLPPKEAP